MKKIFAFLIIICLALSAASCSLQDTGASSSAFSAAPTFDLQAHRGGRDARPENTLYSFLYALECGATTIECDMQLTKDNHIVISHDCYIDPDLTKYSNNGYVSEDDGLDIRNMTLDEVKSFDVSHIRPDTEYYELHGNSQIMPDSAEIPTIEELFDLVKEYDSPVILNMEMKTYPDEEDPRSDGTDYGKYLATFLDVFYDTVSEYDMKNQVTLQSFDWTPLMIMKKTHPEITTVALWSQQPEWTRQDETLRPYEDGVSPYLAGIDIDDFKGDAIEAAHYFGFDAVSPYYKELSLDMIEKAHSYGMKVIPWTVNYPEYMEALYDAGVDGMITDRPWLLREILEKKGETLLPEKEYKDSPYHLDARYNETESDPEKDGANK